MHAVQEGADGAQQVQVTAFQSRRRDEPEQALSPRASVDGPDSDMARALAASRAGVLLCH